MTQIAQLLGDKADYLLNFKNPKISKDRLHVPGPDFVDRIYSVSDRNNRVLGNLQRMFGHGRLGGTGYVSILPVDQGIEHSGGASFAKNPDYFDAENIVKLAIEGGCNAVASTYGVLGAVARKYAHKIPFLVKINHNELLTYPNKFDQIMFGTVKQAADMGAAAVGATIYFGSDQSGRQIVEVAQAFAHAHELGMATVLWCYLRNNAFKVKGADGKARLSRLGRPDRPGQSPGRDHPGGHHQAEAAREQRRLQGAEHRQLQLRQTRRTHLHRADAAIIRLTSAAIRWPTVTWAAPASSTAAANPRARATWNRPSPPPSSTNAPAAWA